MKYVAIVLLLLGLGAVGYGQMDTENREPVMTAEDGTGWPGPKP
jgi:hypothetical protein